MKTLVLVGGGHAHLHCLEQLKNDVRNDWRVLLISPSPYQYYSGMFSGYTEGVYSLDDIRIDLIKLCQNIGVEFSEDAITAVDANAQELRGANGAVYTYDFVSFDIGSQTAVPEAIKNHALSIKPNYRFPDHLVKTRESVHPVIVGGGASGVELAFSILSWRKQNQLSNNVALFSSTDLLVSQGAAASKKIETIATQKDCRFIQVRGLSLLMKITSQQAQAIVIRNQKSYG
ncbi:NADH dehydrogenase-like protein / Selenide,water dikinase [Planococcus halocryophilus Or1]|uniref:NAD(P)/FAD-dependent oxidoreductase n=1 Tax=Planococcus halocryophilus TaxID=1215089 RepID=UPI0002B86CA1|nr:FAD-dependent oxidoreductase [Planococcus halocryophilus]EMF47874.1 NADH dehydrogenase-like protein / Selenide,water dikinase [Planococcus halocryophilus Or1]